MAYGITGLAGGAGAAHGLETLLARRLLERRQAEVERSAQAEEGARQRQLGIQERDVSERAKQREAEIVLRNLQATEGSENRRLTRLTSMIPLIQSGSELGPDVAAELEPFGVLEPGTRRVRGTPASAARQQDIDIRRHLAETAEARSDTAAARNRADAIERAADIERKTRELDEKIRVAKSKEEYDKVKLEFERQKEMYDVVAQGLRDSATGKPVDWDAINRQTERIKAGGRRQSTQGPATGISRDTVLQRMRQQGIDAKHIDAILKDPEALRELMGQ